MRRAQGLCVISPVRLRSTGHWRAPPRLSQSVLSLFQDAQDRRHTHSRTVAKHEHADTRSHQLKGSSHKDGASAKRGDEDTDKEYAESDQDYEDEEIDEDEDDEESEDEDDSDGDEEDDEDEGIDEDMSEGEDEGFDEENENDEESGEIEKDTLDAADAVAGTRRTKEDKNKESVKPARGAAKESANGEEKGWRNPHRFRNNSGSLKGFTLGLVNLPEELRRRIAAMFRGYPRLLLKRDAAGLSASLRARTQLRAGEVRRLEDDIPDVIGYKKHLAYAYCAHRLPGVFGCTFRVLNELKLRRPNWVPQTVLDYGSGPGTAIWSATEVWSNIQDILAVEPSEGMLEMAKTLLEGFRQVQWRRLIPPDEPPRDLVMASYVLTELKDEQERLTKVRQLWNQTKEGGLLLIVEPGTPIGFHVVRTARRLLLSMPSELGTASVLAPCSHNFKCPMTDDSWCHFAQRVQRIPVQISVKDHVTRNYEDECFSYIVMTKGKQLVDAEQDSFDRILRPPQKKSGHVILKTCGYDDGDIRQFIVSRSAGTEIYKDARKSRWGDGFAFENKEDFMRNIDTFKRKGTFRYSDLSKPPIKSKLQRKVAAKKSLKEENRQNKTRARKKRQ